MMVYIQTKVSIPFININIVNPKNGFFFGKFDSCVFWLCGVWWELSDGYYVLLGIAMWMKKLVCVWGLDFFTKGGVHVQWVLLCLMGSLGWFVAM
jgi:hypothetical protein